ncbi:acyltransferase family protein [Novosphingobium colocasiae]
MSIEPGAIERGGVAGRERYVALDAIRGAAALAVLFYHLRNLKPDGITQPDGAEGAMFASGYLAVDLFFVMSGFVIAHAYGHRLGPALPPGRFLALRFVRLQPVMAIGVLIGFGFALVQRLAGLPDAPGLFAIATSLPFNLAMLPNLLLPCSLFLFNAPAWSLFFELAANAGYGVLFARARPIALRVCAGTCMGGLVGLVIVGWQIGDIDHGVDLIHWPVALVRIGFSFPLGVLLYHARDRWARHIPRLPVWLLLAACVAALAPSPQGMWRGLYDIGFATVLSPLLVMLGGGGAARLPQPCRRVVAGSHLLSALCPACADQAHRRSSGAAGLRRIVLDRHGCRADRGACGGDAGGRAGAGAARSAA